MMQVAVKLHVNDLSNALDRDFRRMLIENFAEIKRVLATIDTDSDDGSPDLVTKMDALNNKVNRIVLGTDHEALELVVTEILKKKGVIK